MKKFFFFSLIIAGIIYAGSLGLIDDTLEIPVGAYRYIGFRINPDQAEEATIFCVLAIIPDTSEIELILFHQDDFYRWSGSGEDVDTLFFVTTASDSVSIPISGFGDFMLVLSNRGNFSPLTVAVKAALNCKGFGVTEDPLVVALQLALILMALAAVSVLVAGLIRIRKKASRKKRF